QFYTADQKNGDWRFFTSNGIEVNILNILGRCLVFHRNSLKIYELFKKLIDLLFYLVAISGSIEPTNIGLPAEPGHLTFRIASRITLDYTNRFVSRDTGIEIRNDVPVPDSFERLYAGRHTVRQKLADFFHETSLKHAADPTVDSP